MFSPAGRKRTAAASPGTVRQRARAQAALERAGDRALALVQARVGDRHGRQARELGEDRLVARGVLAPGAVDELDRAELAPAVGQLRAEPRGLGLAAVELRRGGGGERAAAARSTP